MSDSKRVKHKRVYCKDGRPHAWREVRGGKSYACVACGHKSEQLK